VRRELEQLLKAPLLMAEFGGRYPTMLGKLPDLLLRGQAVDAVETLQNNIARTENLLKKSRKRPNKEKKFKGFKKKKKAKPQDS
jgi:hypothetical protein